MSDTRLTGLLSATCNIGTWFELCDEVIVATVPTGDIGSGDGVDAGDIDRSSVNGEPSEFGAGRRNRLITVSRLFLDLGGRPKMAAAAAADIVCSAPTTSPSAIVTIGLDIVAQLTDDVLLMTSPQKIVTSPKVVIVGLQLRMPPLTVLTDGNDDDV
jgi:hypothetical protein